MAHVWQWYQCCVMYSFCVTVNVHSLLFRESSSWRHRQEVHSVSRGGAENYDDNCRLRLRDCFLCIMCLDKVEMLQGTRHDRRLKS